MCRKKKKVKEVVRPEAHLDFMFRSKNLIYNLGSFPFSSHTRLVFSAILDSSVGHAANFYRPVASRSRRDSQLMPFKYCLLEASENRDVN